MSKELRNLPRLFNEVAYATAGSGDKRAGFITVQTAKQPALDVSVDTKIKKPDTLDLYEEYLPYLFAQHAEKEAEGEHDYRLIATTY